MFDAQTVELIRAAPELEGLDLRALPRDLTAAYAEIVAARIRLREARDQTELQTLAATVRDTVSRMRRLAFTQEALISLQPEAELRAPGAFVAGAAHHVVVQAARLLLSEAPATRLEIDGVSSEISATLLFLIAESHADAAEMARTFEIHEEDDRRTETSLIRAIQDLALGRLGRIVDDEVVGGLLLPSLDSERRGAAALYLMLLLGIRALAKKILGLEDQDPEGMFRLVASLASRPIEGTGMVDGLLAYSVYPGPAHLASLLIVVARELPVAALTNVPPPSNVDGARWLAKMGEIAGKRPYLWRNHREAISRGYLEPGVSSAVSFPTGAGKSTLSELKIASALLRGQKVVFLAPTLALVDQTARGLRALFPQDDLQMERSSESVLDISGDGLPAISVMTPERCLAVMGFEPESFSGVGLLVFDECHLLHPRGSDRSRRSIDAMLCLLNFSSIAPHADLLLMSAMMSNSDSLAEWLTALTERPCLALNLTWKPTRQVRGCVVYSASDVQLLRDRLAEVRGQVSNISAPTWLKRQMVVSPYGFFCLHQTWQSQQRSDYSLLRLLDRQVELATATSATGWYLTPNGGKVAAEIAIGAGGYNGRVGALKTLVFTPTIPQAGSGAKYICGRLQPSNCDLTADELLLYQSALDEMGDASHLYVDVSNDFKLRSSSLPHHGLLLASERNLHESLYRRPDGVSVLVATSTLAQGMNLPSQVVIISSDSRFDPDANQMEKLEAHELLNAAGRAGRAGETSYGFVLVVPSKVMDFNEERSTIHRHWTELRAIFAQSDQCLAIEDPLVAVLDRIHMAGDDLSDADKYLLRRLPVSSDGAGSDAPAVSLLARSMGAYFKRRQGDNAWIDSRISAALAARRRDPDSSVQPDWIDRLASVAGVMSGVMRGLDERLQNAFPAGRLDVIEWREWVWAWLVEQPELLPRLVRRESLENLLGASYKRLVDDADRGLYAIPILRGLLARWMAGDALVDIETTFGTQRSRLGKCEAAREFVVRLVPELAYVFALPEQIVHAKRLTVGSEERSLAASYALSGCIREGFDSLEKLALFQIHRRSLSRRAVHRDWDAISRIALSALEDEDWDAAIARVKSASIVARNIQ
jgi:hypothetical protein